MKLTELEPRALRIRDPKTWAWSPEYDPDADGVFFLCPKCFSRNGGAAGTHRVICWRPRVPLSMDPGPGRWELQGSSWADLSLVGGSSSIRLPGEDPQRPETKGACGAHFFVTNGQIVNS